MEFLTSPQTYIIVHRLSMGHQAVMFLSTTMSEFYKLKKLWNRYIWTLFIVSKRIPWLHHSTPAGGVPPVGARSVILLPTYWVSVTWADIERPHWVGWEPQPVKVQHKHRRRELCPVHTLTLKTLVNSTLHTYKTSHTYTAEKGKILPWFADGSARFSPSHRIKKCPIKLDQVFSCKFISVTRIL